MFASTQIVLYICHVPVTINRNIILLQYYQIKREQFLKKVNHCIENVNSLEKYESLLY